MSLALPGCPSRDPTARAKEAESAENGQGVADEEEESAVKENHAGAGASDSEATDVPVLNEDGDAFDWNNPKPYEDHEEIDREKGISQKEGDIYI